MEKYTIPIEKAVELTPVSSEPVSPFLSLIDVAYYLVIWIWKVLNFFSRITSLTFNRCGASRAAMESTADQLLPIVLWPLKRPSQATMSPTLSTAASSVPVIQSDRLNIVLNVRAMEKVSSRGLSTPPRKPG